MLRRSAAELRGQHGFTMLECVVAVLVMALAMIGLSRLVVAHDRLVQGLEAWTDGTPVRFVDVPDDPLQSLAGVPATLVEDPPASPVPPVSGVLEVAVLSVERTLEPPTVALHVELSEVVP